MQDANDAAKRISETLAGAASSANKEANKSVAKDPHKSLSTRLADAKKTKRKKRSTRVHDILDPNCNRRPHFFFLLLVIMKRICMANNIMYLHK
ncbi:hypothetical protein PGT21_033107 [Puccinia graminis f. sp. tritici]|uniref:Uncharacterized protein n=1 Tax=Puccinia graminis f. sp. tritici TaxID=56615 RepID=A0A5B0M0C4_PUCGR|nr:hypothetical protein PGT21_033107 [Puccinia graminis f. sp. tritici]